MRYRRKHSILIKKKHIKIIAPILAVIIIIVVIVTVTSANKIRSDKQKAVDHILQIGIINIGLRGDIGALCTYNTESQSFEGLEKDIADEIVSRLFGGDIIVNYITVNSETKDALIRIGDLDIALGASLESDISGVAYSSTYYTDGSAFLVTEGEMLSQDGLGGRAVAIVQASLAAGENEKDSGVNRMQIYLDTQGIDAKVKVFASYPEAIDALREGFVGGVCANEIFLKLHGKKGMLILPERFLPHHYRVEASESLGALNDAISDVITQMREDGTLDALIAKWNLIDYAALEE